MTSKPTYRIKAISRRSLLEGTLAGSALVAAPAFVRPDPTELGVWMRRLVAEQHPPPP